ncbi:hypothetical protein N7501_002129 [Penicillium viridicatum]|nr:hypothetical protein N7501_002129 [Penicillium viridicatum]
METVAQISQSLPSIVLAPPLSPPMPISVTNCPPRSKTTYLTTETLIVSTTVCPVADATGVNGAVPTKNTTVTEVIGGGENGISTLTTSTIFATRTATM